MKGDTGNYLPVVAVNPDSVCCDAALLATALGSVCVKLHPQFPFAATVEEDGTRHWRWLFAPKSECGTYKTSALVAWWNDAKWHTENPTHEFAIVARVLRNQAANAKLVRSTIPRLRIVRGERKIFIPETASPARRAHLLGMLEGTIPPGTKFVEPTP